MREEKINIKTRRRTVVLQRCPVPGAGARCPVTGARFELWPFLCFMEEYSRITIWKARPNDKEGNLRSIGILDSFWGNLWLEL